MTVDSRCSLFIKFSILPTGECRPGCGLSISYQNLPIGDCWAGMQQVYRVYRYHKLRGSFSKFCGLVSEFQVRLGSLLHRGLSEPDFYGDLVYGLKKIVASNNFSAQFI